MAHDRSPHALEFVDLVVAVLVRALCIVTSHCRLALSVYFTTDAEPQQGLHKEKLSRTLASAGKCV